jgi:trans-aconitate 2-methyltransferase
MAAPVASGRTESELPGSEGWRQLSLGGLTVPAAADGSGNFPPEGEPEHRRLGFFPMTADEQSTGAAGSSQPAGWDPATYLRYAGERARPFVDLLSRVAAVAPDSVVDLGCGEGALTASLAQRWPGARVTGIDSSPSMLAAAATHAVPGRVEFVAGDVRDWAPDAPVDVVVSNAVLHWVAGHDAVLTRCAGWLRPGGWLAVQVPGNFRAPTHALLAELCLSPRWASLLDAAAPRPDTVLEPAGYLDVLTAAGLSSDVWETTYLHVLSGSDPVLGWVRSTVLRPVLALLPDDEAAEFTAEYAAALRAAYPARPDGTTLLPFRRVFAVGSRPS